RTEDQVAALLDAASAGRIHDRAHPAVGDEVVGGLDARGGDAIGGAEARVGVVPGVEQHELVPPAVEVDGEEQPIRIPSGRRGQSRPGAEGGVEEDAPSQQPGDLEKPAADRKSTRLNSSHVKISYAVFCLKKK